MKKKMPSKRKEQKTEEKEEEDRVEKNEHGENEEINSCVKVPLANSVDKMDYRQSKLKKGENW